MDTNSTETVVAVEAAVVAPPAGPTKPALNEEALMAKASGGSVSVSSLTAEFDCTKATAMKYLKAACDAGKLARSTETLKGSGRGRPQFLFVLPTDPKAAPAVAPAPVATEVAAPAQA